MVEDRGISRPSLVADTLLPELALLCAEATDREDVEVVRFLPSFPSAEDLEPDLGNEAAAFLADAAPGFDDECPITDFGIPDAGLEDEPDSPELGRDDEAGMPEAGRVDAIPGVARELAAPALGLAPAFPVGVAVPGAALTFELLTRGVIPKGTRSANRGLAGSKSATPSATFSGAPNGSNSLASSRVLMFAGLEALRDLGLCQVVTLVTVL